MISPGGTNRPLEQESIVADPADRMEILSRLSDSSGRRLRLASGVDAEIDEDVVKVRATEPA